MGTHKKENRLGKIFNKLHVIVSIFLDKLGIFI